MFQRVREIVDENQENDWAQNNALGYSSLDRERRWKNSVESHMLPTRVEEVSKPCVELALDAIGR